MKKVNIAEIHPEPFTSPKSKFASVSQNISVALGRVDKSDKKTESHPFDVELCRIPPGKSLCPYHSHTTQTEFYLVVSGRGMIRDETGQTEVGPGDAFVFRAGEAHQLSCHGKEDFVVYIIADNPPGDACYYPDSRKISYPFPGARGRFTLQDANYFDGEE